MQGVAVRSAPRSLIVALDIGTHASGFCWVKPPSTTVHTFESWPDQSAPYPKARSALLYRGRSPVAWGWSAGKQHAQLTAQQLSEGTHWYIEDFKLALQDDTHAAALRAKGLTPEQVMADFLRPFVSFIKQQLRAAPGVTAADLTNIQWCLTVPAMWSEASKQLMRKAAVRAGLIRTQDSDALMIILEPEAAAVHAMENRAPPLVKGMTVCILDVGGGTADITVHDVKEVAGRSVLAEAVAAHGELCGSVYVDKAFREYYREQVGGDAFDMWAVQHPNELHSVMDRWLACKHTYTGGHDLSVLSLLHHHGTTSYRVLIPPNLKRLMNPARKVHLGHQVLQHGLQLDDNTMRHLFEGPVTMIINAAKQQLQQLATPCAMVLLVGGFANSPYLQHRVQQAIRTSRLASQVFVPPQPHAAVLKEAARGADPTNNHRQEQRKAANSETSTNDNELRERAQTEDDAPDVSRFWHDEKRAWCSNAYFTRFVSKEQLVHHNEVVERTFLPCYKSSTETPIAVHATEDNCLKWIRAEDPVTHELGAVVVQLSTPGRERKIAVQFAFGDTELKVSAWDKATRQKVHAEFKFAHDRA